MDRDTMSEIRVLKQRIQKLEEMVSAMCHAIAKLDRRTRSNDKEQTDE